MGSKLGGLEGLGKIGGLECLGELGGLEGARGLEAWTLDIEHSKVPLQHARPLEGSADSHNIHVEGLLFSRL